MIAATELGGCHRKVEDPAAVTTDEQAQLNDAAAMLDANSAANIDTADDDNIEDPS